MLVFAPFEPGHLAAIRLARGRAYLDGLARSPAFAAPLVVPGLAWTAFAGGEAAVAGGILPLDGWRGRAMAWTFVGEAMPVRAWRRLTRHCLAVLAAAQADGLWRIEASVEARFAEGHRWAQLLGFAAEGLMRAYDPEGRDHVLYARVAAASDHAARRGEAAAPGAV